MGPKEKIGIGILSETFLLKEHFLASTNAPLPLPPPLLIYRHSSTSVTFV
jgi:hypothetical protein